MLYEFHNYQNAQRANSVHATYLIYGTKIPDKDQSDGDVEMSGSSPEEPLSDEVPTSILTLAREEELNDILAAFEQVVSIHVYSLALHPQKDLSLLSDITTQLAEYSSNGDITEASKKYGVISNPHAKRRERSRPQASASAPSKAVKKEPPTSTKAKQEASVTKPEAKQTKPTKQEPSAPSSKEGTPAPSGGKKPAPSLKRGASGGIMQSFAKAAARPPKPKPAPKKEEDIAMALSDDGEADDSDIIATKSKPAVDSADIKRKRQEREDALRKMMEDDDEEDEEEEESDKESEQADEDMEEAPEPEPEPEAKKEENEPSEVISSTGDGRRRGRRRVMKKKRILDDQGYMVTIQEPGWESFSEDEAPPPAKKAAPTPTPSSSSGSKGKKPAPKGQGNIMSFFSKK
ncbi:hypothetical protein IL306_000994 [Fusarium sp. DS 682]|nr:hypothetical protein IL306_000994 [Fusarium sp. DS 682]